MQRESIQLRTSNERLLQAIEELERFIKELTSRSSHEGEGSGKKKERKRKPTQKDMRKVKPLDISPERKRNCKENSKNVNLPLMMVKRRKMQKLSF